jgi:hypothetical protein
MKCVASDQVVLSNAPEVTPAAHIGSFAEFVSAKGDTVSSIHLSYSIVSSPQNYVAYSDGSLSIYPCNTEHI